MDEFLFQQNPLGQILELAILFFDRLNADIVHHLGEQQLRHMHKLVLV